MTEQRFWELVDASGDCWEWTGGRICRKCHAMRQDGYRKADPEKYAAITARSLAKKATA
jgi:hypothetical protein